MRIKRGWMNLKVDKIIEETHDSKTLFFVNEEENERAFDYRAGQYLTFRFDGLSEKPIVRSYTMSSAPCEPKAIAVTVKEVEEGFISHYLCRDVKEGDVLRARGPIGKFCYLPEENHKNIVMVAAGSGVTPFISMMKQFAHDKHQGLTAHLIVSYRSKKDLICWKELEEINQSDFMKVDCTLSREVAVGFHQGRINNDLLANLIQNYDSSTFFTCGPDAMMEKVALFLKSKNVSENHIKLESFS